MHRPAHWIFDGTGLREGDTFGGDSTIVGYECDGCEFKLSEGKPVPTRRDGTPDSFQILATAPARWPPGEFGWLEGWDHGREGNACMGLHRRPAGGGTVFAAATTDWVHGLRDGDPVVEQITRNVLNRLSRPDAAR